MALTAVAVCNQALALLGQKAITTLAGTDTASKACNALYETLRDEVLSAREWAFATKWRTLVPDSAPPGNPRYNAKYTRHADQLRVLEVCHAEGETDAAWTPEGDSILLDEVVADDATTVYSPSTITAHAQASYIGYLGAAVWALTGTCTAGPHHVIMHWASEWDSEAEAFVRGSLCLIVNDVIYFVAASSFAGAAVVDLGDAGVTPLDGISLQLVVESAPVPFTPMFYVSWTWDIGTPREAGEDLIYVRALEKMTDPSTWPAYFVKAFAARMAADLAVPLTENFAAQVHFEKLYQMRLREAAAVDGMQGRTAARRTSALSSKRST